MRHLNQNLRNKKESSKERRGPGRGSESREDGRIGPREVVWLLHGMMGAGGGTDALFVFIIMYHSVLEMDQTRMLVDTGAQGGAHSGPGGQ